MTYVLSHASRLPPNRFIFLPFYFHLPSTALARLKRHVSSLTKYESNCFLASSLNFTLPLMSNYFKINTQDPVAQH